MAKVIYQNVAVVALNEQAVKMQSGDERRKLEIQITENSRDGMIIVGGIEAWDDTIDTMQLAVGTQLAELHCKPVSRYKDGRWWWTMQAYKAVLGETKSEGVQDAF